MGIEKLDLLTKPFLRWPGGKKWFIRHLESLLPPTINNYYEPFLGSGSVFFSLNKGYYKKAYLSDTNDDLINAYLQIKNNHTELIKTIKIFRNNETFYYAIRKRDFDPDPIFRAARMLYLNKTGFNGIYRVNSLGRFNVPYGFRSKIDLVDKENIEKVSLKLKNVKIKTIDFEKALSNVKEGDLVVIDPPYTVAHENNGFIEYNKKLFSLEDQIRLSKVIKEISDKGGYYILTNAKHKKILEIYSCLGRPKIFQRHSHIGGTGAIREDIKEYVFSNCF